MRKTASQIKQDALLRKFGLKPRASKANRKKSVAKSQKIARLKRMPYKDFLKTNYWKNVRELVLARDGFKCVVCKSNVCLHIHHDTYKNHGDEANNLKDLMTLCSVCHKEHHFAQK